MVEPVPATPNHIMGRSAIVSFGCLKCLGKCATWMFSHPAKPAIVRVSLSTPWLPIT